MNGELVPCPHCGASHATREPACPVTGSPLPLFAGDAAHLVIFSATGETRAVTLHARNTLGRHPENSIQLLDTMASKQHCTIEWRGSRYFLRDQGSLNGTYVNGARLSGEIALVYEDEIATGGTRFVFRSGVAQQHENYPDPIPLAPERLLAHLASDRPVYHPGDVLYARAILLDAFTRAPARRTGSLIFELRSPAGDVVVRRPAGVDRAVAPFAWTIPARHQAGAYTLVARSPESAFPPAEISIAVRSSTPAHPGAAARAADAASDRIRLSFYPEGGQLVAGLSARLYFEARTAKGKPAEASGRIVDASGATVAQFRTEHEGRGRVEFTPDRSGRVYMAVLDGPAGELFPLPEIVASGFALTSIEDEALPDEPVRLRVASTAGGRARVALYMREREMAATRITIAAGGAVEVVLTPAGAADGVLRATVFDETGLPRAERLVFRRPLRSLRVEVEPNPRSADLRAPVALRVRTTDTDGRPVKATVTIAVVDEAVIAAVPRRALPPRLHEQALLGGEVFDLADPRAYLGEDEVSRRRLDLLLATQGWRTFAFFHVEEFVEEHPDRAERVLARRRFPASSLLVSAFAALDATGAVPAVPRDPGAPALTPPAFAAPVLGPPEDLVIFDRVGRARKPGEERKVILPFAVREYAHRAAADLDAERVDLAETLYWNAGLTTSAGGEATVTFDLADSVTRFRVHAEAVDAGGALGAGDAEIEARRP